MKKQQPKPQLTAVLYARYSSNNQREESIEGQIRECEYFAQREGITIANHYIDRAMSARTDHRPAFLHMIEDSKQNTFDIVLVYQLDRFSRNRADSAKYRAILKHNGVRVLSAKERIGDDPTGILLEAMIDGVNEYYSAELAQKVTRGMTENALNGRWPGGKVPLGYKLSPEKFLIIDEGPARIVRTVFAMYNSGQTINAIIQHLNEQGYKTVTGGPFNRSSLEKMLRNEKYIGTFVWRDIVHLKKIPDIITEEEFYMAQKRIESQKNRPPAASRSEHYYLTGKIKCGKCGASMIGMSGTSGTNKTPHHYYTCYNRRRGNTCDMKTLKRDQTEDTIVEVAKGLLNDPKNVEIIAKLAAKAAKTAGETNYIKELENELKDKSKRIDNLMKTLETGITSETVMNRMKELESDKSFLEKKIHSEKVINRPLELLTEEHIIFFLEKMGEKNTDEYKENVLSIFVREVIVYDDHIDVKYNYSEQISPSCDVITGSPLTAMVDLSGIKTNCKFYATHFIVRLKMPA